MKDHQYTITKIENITSQFVVVFGLYRLDTGYAILTKIIINDN